MKSLNLSRPHVLMIVGLPGAGKSFFARQFSETFGAPVVSTDRIRYELFDHPTYNSSETDLITRLAVYQTEELFKTNRSFILEGGCNGRADRTRVGQAARKAGYDVSVVWVQTDPATCRARALKRNPEKRPDDKYSPSLTEQQFEAFTKRFTEPVRENHIVISGKHTYNTQAKMVLRKLIAAREAKAEAVHRKEAENVRHSSQRPETRRRGVIIR